MKNKIIVSLILILFLAISASAVSANEDIDETITATSDSSDIELSAEEANTLTISDETTEILDEEDSKDKNKLEGGVSGTNFVPIKKLSDLKKYLEDTGSTHYPDGYIYNLDNNTFELDRTINIKKCYTIDGGIIKADNLDYFFNIESPANGGPTSVTIKNTKFIITKNQSVIFAKGINEGYNKVLNIAGITLENITLQIENGVTPSTVSLLKIDTTPQMGLYSNEINIIDNILNGANIMNVQGVLVNEDSIHFDATEIVYPKNTIIQSYNIIYQYIVDKAVGDTPIPFQVKLCDENNNPVANKVVSFALNAEKLTATTNSAGIATLMLSLSTAKTYDIYTIFEGDGEYNPSSLVANTITLFKKDSVLAAKNVSFKVTASKKLSVTFKSPIYEITSKVKNGALVINKVIKGYKLIKNKKVTFTVNGKTYTATTNSKGVAAVKINLNKKGTYYYLAQYAGDSIYNKVVKKAKLTIIPLATSLTTKKFTYKKAARTKILYTVLKSGKTALRNQKVVFRVNGKNYIAKTNAKGLAKVKIALNKKGTFTYAVKYEGNNVYKSIAKTNKIAII